MNLEGKVLSQLKPTLIELQTEATAGNDYCSLRPPAGKIWIPIWALGFHDDDAANRTLQWRLYDAGGDCGLRAGESLAANAYSQLYDASIKDVFFLEYSGLYIKLLGVSIVVGHHLELRAMVYELTGVPTRVV